MQVAVEKVSTNPNAYVGRMQGVAWEGKQTVHVDLHADAFKPIGADFKSGMKSFGWHAEDHIQKLVPVCLKIHNPNLTRK